MPAQGRIQPITMVSGLYRHYKGDSYVVIGLAWQSDNGRERVPVVVYVSLTKGTINVRTESEFHEHVSVEGKHPMESNEVPRFAYVGPAR